MAQNQVEQKLKLNVSDYTANLGLAAREATRTMSLISKALNQGGGDFDSFSNKVKKESFSVTRTLEDMAKGFSSALGKNLVIGGAAGVGFAAGNAALNQIKEIATYSMSMGKAIDMARGRFGFNPDQQRAFKQAVYATGTTGAAVDESTAAGVQILAANGGNIKGMAPVLKQIAGVAGAERMNPAMIAEYVVNRLTGRNLPINAQNVNSLLGSTFSARNGGRISDFGEAMQLISGVDAGAQMKARISDQDLAARFAGASQAGQGKDITTAAMQEMIRLDDSAWGGSLALRGALGMNTNRREHLNFERDFGRGADTQRRLIQQMGSQSNVEDFYQKTGNMSAEAAKGLFAVLRDFNAKVLPTYQKTLGRQANVEATVATETDNVGDKAQILKNRYVTHAMDALDQDAEFIGNLFRAPRKDRRDDSSKTYEDAQKAVKSSTAPGFGDVMRQLMTLPSQTAAAIRESLSKTEIKSKVEVHSKDPGLKAHPKASDNARHPGEL